MPWTKKNTTEILKALRLEMASAKPSPLAAYLVPSEDAHLNEYLAGCDARRTFVSGFTGSRGLAIVTTDKAALWTDGRYFLQAAEEMDSNWQLMKEGVKDVKTPREWLAATLQDCPLQVVGVDPWLMSSAGFANLTKELIASGLQLIAVPENLVDKVWGTARPARPSSLVWQHELKFAGKTWQEKVSEVQKKLKEQHCSHLVVSALDDIAWLLNLRGSDIDFNKLFFAFAVVSTSSLSLVISEKQMSPDLTKHLKSISDGALSPVEIEIIAVADIYKAFQEHLLNLTNNKSEATTKGRIWVPDSCPQLLTSLFPESMRHKDESPIPMLKAVKNAVEIEGFRTAHIKDAVAHCQFLHWIENEVCTRNLTELQVAAKFEELRKLQPDYIDLSFETISAVNANAAMCHYAPSADNDGIITKDSIYLIDSGGHYRDGTTDVTRTIHFGEPTVYQMECFTAVLKGHIALATCVFPENTSGYRLDCLARQALYQLGLEYMHGTGHGVGHCLSVHEGPAGFHFRRGASEAGVKEGMILTIEPGYYEDNQFGIRIENVCVTKAVNTKYRFNNNVYLGFEPLTLVPIQHKLIDVSMLTKQEIDWVDKYHELCFAKLGNLLPPELQEWLRRQCRPLLR